MGRERRWFFGKLQKEETRAAGVPPLLSVHSAAAGRY
jgi:hypothetical protein